MTSIHVEDIMFSENTIVVNKTKNRNGLLLVINDELLAILETYIRLFHLNSEDYLFSTGNGTKLANRTMEDFVNRYSAKRGYLQITCNPCVQTYLCQELLFTES